LGGLEVLDDCRRKSSQTQGQQPTPALKESVTYRTSPRPRSGQRGPCRADHELPRTRSGPLQTRERMSTQAPEACADRRQTDLRISIAMGWYWPCLNSSVASGMLGLHGRLGPRDLGERLHTSRSRRPSTTLRPYPPGWLNPGGTTG
jgi:hypothetical protein